MPFIQFPEWGPDQPPFENKASSTISNVLPRTKDSYGPVPGLSNFLAALNAKCQGARGLRDSQGNGTNLAGTSTKLYKYAVSDSAWTDVSGGTYTIPNDEQWRFTQNGDTAIACNISDGLVSRDLVVGGNFAALAAAAPLCREMAISRNFLLVGNTSGGSADPNGPTANPQRVWWPKIGDPTTWPTLDTSTAAQDQSDAQDIVGDHGWLTGIVTNLGPADAIILFERAVFRAMYIGAPDVWGFYPAYGIKGCIASSSVQITEWGVIYLSVDGWVLYDGNQQVFIGFEKIDKTFYSDIDQEYIGHVSSAVDPINKLYWFGYPSLAGLYGDGVIDTLLVCNYALQSTITQTPGRWAKITPASGIEVLWKYVTLGFNLDNAGSLGFNVDTSPYGPDSRFWTSGGQEALAAFDTTHTAATFTGSNLAPTLDTSEYQPLRGRLAYIDRVRPISDGGTSITVQCFSRNKIQDSSTGGQVSTMNSSGNCFLRSVGMNHRYEMKMAAGSTFSHIQGIDVPDDEIKDMGVR